MPDHEKPKQNATNAKDETDVTRIIYAMDTKTTQQEPCEDMTKGRPGVKN